VTIVLQGVAEAKEARPGRSGGGGGDGVPPLVRAALRQAATQRASEARAGAARVKAASAQAAALRNAGLEGAHANVDMSKFAHATVVVPDDRVEDLVSMGAAVIERKPHKTTLEMRRGTTPVYVVVHKRFDTKTQTQTQTQTPSNATQLSAVESDALYALTLLTGVPHYPKVVPRKTSLKSAHALRDAAPYSVQLPATCAQR
jgi:hypothetical protein